MITPHINNMHLALALLVACLVCSPSAYVGILVNHPEALPVHAPLPHLAQILHHRPTLMRGATPGSAPRLLKTPTGSRDLTVI